MKNRLVKKIMRIVLLSFVGLLVLSTFIFLWKKAQRAMWNLVTRY